MSARSTRFAHRIPAAAAVMLIALSLACARPHTEQPPVKPQIRMTAEAAEVYYYLVLNEAAKSNDVRLGAEAIRRLLELNPDEQIYVDAARFYGARKDIITARQIAKQGLGKYPDSFDLTMLVAESYVAEKRNPESIALLKEYIRAHPKHAEARQQLAQLMLANGMHQEAADLLRAKSPHREDPVTRYYLARALTHLKKYHEAETELRKAVKSSPEFVEAWAELAYVHELKKDYVAAEKTYEHIIEMGQSGQEIWLRLIAINIKLNHPEKALSIAKEGPEETGFYLQAATLFLDEGFPEQARELLEPLAAENNPPAEVFFHLALIAFNQDKDLPRAIELLENIPDHNPLWGKSVRFRSHLLFELKRHDDAVQLLYTGIRTDPGDREFWDLLVDQLAVLKRYDEAHEVLDKALKRWPNDGELLFSKASIYDLANEKDKAFDMMEQVITIDPEHPQALNYVGYSLADKGIHLERALVLIETALKSEPDKPFILDSLAWVHFKLGNFDLAWDAIKRTVALGAKDPVIWEHYGDIAAKLGYRSEARKGYRNAIKMTPDNIDDIKSRLRKL